MPPPPRTQRGRPVVTPLEQTYPEVFFRLATTGLDPRTQHITQISAVRGGDGGSFNCFVRPKVQISPKVTRLTGISCVNGQMFLCSQAVESVSITNGLDSFCQFLGDNPCVLIAHGAIGFHSRFLHNAAMSTERVEELKKRVAGFLDTLRLFQKQFPGLPLWYTQRALVQYFLHESYDAHDGVVCAKMLMNLLNFKIDWMIKKPSTCNWDYIGESVAFHEQSRQGQGDEASRGGTQRRGRRFVNRGGHQDRSTVEQGQGSNGESQGQGDSLWSNQRGNRGNRRGLPMPLLGGFLRGGYRGGRNTRAQNQGVHGYNNENQGQGENQWNNENHRSYYNRGGYRGGNQGQRGYLSNHDLRGFHGNQNQRGSYYGTTRNRDA